jgi:hypothetical protein
MIIVGTLLFIASVNHGTCCIQGVPNLTSPIPVTKLAAVVESSLPNPANEPSSKNGECSSSNNDTRRRATVISVRIRTSR